MVAGGGLGYARDERRHRRDARAYQARAASYRVRMYVSRERCYCHLALAVINYPHTGVCLSHCIFARRLFPMIFFSRTTGKSRAVALAGCFLAVLLLLAACGGGTTGSGSTPTANPATPTVTPPNDLLVPGTLTVGSDTTYPPQEYIDTATNKPAGFDIDLITAIAQRMG